MMHLVLQPSKQRLTYVNIPCRMYVFPKSFYRSSWRILLLVCLVIFFFLNLWMQIFNCTINYYVYWFVGFAGKNWKT